MADAIINIRTLDNGTNQAFQRIIRDAERYRDLINQTSRANATGSRDYLQQLREQTRALERQFDIAQKLREQELRRQTADAIAANRAEADDEVNTARRKSPFGFSDAQEKEIRDKYEKNNKELVDEMNRLISEDKETNKLLMQVLRQFLEDDSQENLAEIREQEQEEKDDREKEKEKKDGEKEKKESPAWLQVMLGTLFAGFIQNLKQLPNALASAQTGDFVVAKFWEAIPFVGSALAQASQRSLEQQFKVEQAEMGLRGTTGHGNAFGFELERFGIDRAEASSYAEQIARTRGYRGNLETDTARFLGTRAAFNVDQSTLLSLTGHEQYTTSGSAMQSVLNVLNAYKSVSNMGDDISRLPKLLEIQNQLVQENGQYLERINDKQSAATIAAFQAVGGSFADNRAGGRISQINNALRNGGNDYQQAMNYAVLANKSPNASFLDILKMQEGGLGTAGFLRGTLDLISQQAGGNNDIGSILTAKRLGLSYSAAERLFQNRNKFDDQMLVREFETEGSVLAKGEELTGTRSKKAAEIEDGFGESMWKGLQSAGQQVADGIADSIRDVTKDSTMWSGVGESIAAGIEDYFGGSKFGNLKTKK